jgi:hypothetical protein
MKIATRVDCSPAEARRLLGWPDLLPLYQIAAVTVERWLMARIARLDLTGSASPSEEADGGACAEPREVPPWRS